VPGPLPNAWGVEPCLDLVNSRWSDHLGSGRQFDRLPEPRWRRAFLEQWRYHVDDPDDTAAQARLARLRGSLRELLESYIAGGQVARVMAKWLESEMNRAPLKLSLEDTTGPCDLVLSRSGDPWDVVTSEIATSAARLIARKRNLKVCANPHCTWMFVDRSRSGRRRWCDVSICGSLVNVRRFRASRAAH
jgi:predicted RNA-binding Zn ribbon-like protein